MKTVVVWDEYGVFGLGLKNLLEEQDFRPKVHVTGDLAALERDHSLLEDADLILWGVSDQHTDRDLSALIRVIQRAPRAVAICIVSRSNVGVAASLLETPKVGLIYRETLPRDVALVVELALSCPDYVTLPRAPEVLGASISGAGHLVTLATSHPSHVDVQFTTAQEKILQRLLEGKSNKEIARDLGLSDNTVRSHLYNVMQKCRVRSRRELAALVQEGRELPLSAVLTRRPLRRDEGAMERAAASGSLS